MNQLTAPVLQANRLEADTHQQLLQAIDDALNMGATTTEIAEALGISVVTLWRWRKEHEAER